MDADANATADNTKKPEMKPDIPAINKMPIRMSFIKAFITKSFSLIVDVDKVFNIVANLQHTIQLKNKFTIRHLINKLYTIKKQ